MLLRTAKPLLLSNALSPHSSWKRTAIYEHSYVQEHAPNVQRSRRDCVRERSAKTNLPDELLERRRLLQRRKCKMNFHSTIILAHRSLSAESGTAIVTRALLRAPVIDARSHDASDRTWFPRDSPGVFREQHRRNNAAGQWRTRENDGRV